VRSAHDLEVEVRRAERSHQPQPHRQQQVREWVQGLAADAGAGDPAGLARSLTLVLDGDLARGALDADPAVADEARLSAALLVDAAVTDGA
jgi:hypothetical protein